MRQVLIDLMHSLASAKTLIEVNIAAGIAAQRMQGIDDEPVESDGNPVDDRLKRI